jgi:hypothetical protein
MTLFCETFTLRPSFASFSIDDFGSVNPSAGVTNCPCAEKFWSRKTTMSVNMSIIDVMLSLTVALPRFLPLLLIDWRAGIIE